MVLSAQVVDGSTTLGAALSLVPDVIQSGADRSTEAILQAFGKASVAPRLSRTSSGAGSIPGGRFFKFCESCTTIVVDTARQVGSKVLAFVDNHPVAVGVVVAIVIVAGIRWYLCSRGDTEVPAQDPFPTATANSDFVTPRHAVRSRSASDHSPPLRLRGGGNLAAAFDYDASAEYLKVGECTICMEFPCSVLFVPCGHLATCSACHNRVSVCPICRQSIRTRVRLQPC